MPPSTLTYDEIRSTQTPADAIAGSLVVGYSIEGLKDLEAFAKLQAFAKQRGLALFFGGGDAENTPDEHLVGLYPWLLGTEVLRVEGGYEQASGFEYKPGGRLDATRAELGARAAEVAEFAKSNGLSTSACETFLVARGGLALALLLKGEWLDAPEEDEEELYTWFDQHQPTAAPNGEVGYRHGTKGSSQEPFPALVHGICIQGADATSERVTLDAETDAALDARLAAAGIRNPRYFLITRYD